MDQFSTVSVLPSPARPSCSARSVLSTSTLSGSDATSGMRNTSLLHLPSRGASPNPSRSAFGRRSMTTSACCDASSCAIDGCSSAIRASVPNKPVPRFFKVPPVARRPGRAWSSLSQRRERALDEWRERPSRFLDAGVRLSERGQLRHLQSGVATGIDALEGLEFHVHVERQAVVAGAATDAQAHAGDLAAIDVDAGRVPAAFGRDAETGAIIDDGALQRRDEIAHTESGAADVDEWIDHELAGAVIGHLAATVDLDHGDIARGEYVAGVGIEAQREHRGMFEHPDLVRRVLVACVGDALHLAP